ncbi:hypothetical protein IEO21_10654 [Rhodonia placenta]|uniref:Uncharacterized protein n=1 Tax=Rhodonia placenta TaxID=104341 RepID=A0A8H7TXB9_9APHY|nr:hypothetical protein IEO21_10654 [Postia placenta]
MDREVVSLGLLVSHSGAQ